MKNIQAIFYLATMIGGVLSVASCNNAAYRLLAASLKEAHYQKNVNMVSLPCMVKKERSLTVE